MFRRTVAASCLLFALACAALSAQEAESLYSSATRAFQGGLYLMAARSLRQLAEQYPSTPWPTTRNTSKAWPRTTSRSTPSS